MTSNSSLSDELMNEDGTTLVEVLVSMALIVSVILPAIIFLGYIAHYPQNKNKVIALSRAQTTMEELLNQNEFTEGENITNFRSAWFLKEQIIFDSSRVTINVSVFHRDRKLVSLSTVRLHND